MKRTRIASVLLAVMVLAVVPKGGYASPDDELRKAANLTTIAEVTLSAASLIADHKKKEIEELSWSGRYSGRNWEIEATVNVDDEKIILPILGYLWGEDRKSWTVSYSGKGRTEEGSIIVYGQALWHFEDISQDYKSMDFRQVMRFDTNSEWGWVLGAEILFGGTVAAGAALATAGLSTGGVALGAAPWIAAGGFTAGGAALVGASAAAKSLLESNEAPELSVIVQRPVLPKEGTELKPTKSMIYTVVGDGKIRGSAPDGVYVLSGTYNEKIGYVEGRISAKSE